MIKITDKICLPSSFPTTARLEQMVVNLAHANRSNFPFIARARKKYAFSHKNLMNYKDKKND